MNIFRMKIRKGSPFPRSPWTAKLFVNGKSVCNFSYPTFEQAIFYGNRIATVLTRDQEDYQPYYTLRYLPREVSGCKHLKPKES